MVFVTGGTGLVGSHIICQLLKKGHSVKALCRRKSDKTWFEKTAKFLLKGQTKELLENVNWVQGDLFEIGLLSEYIEGCTQVYHCAALVSFAKKDQSALYETNVIGTANLLNVCLSMVSKPAVCFISSTASIGGVDKKIIDETFEYSSENAGSYYSQTKFLAEMEAFRAREEGLDVAILNPCVVLGFSNWHTGSSRLFKNYNNGFPFYTSGSNAFVDARDVADCAILLMENRIFDNRYLCIGWNKTYKEVFDAIAQNFGMKKPSIRVNRLMAEIAWRLAGVASLLGIGGTITKETARSGMKNRNYSSQKLIEATGFNFRNFEESIAEICSTYKDVEAI
ncbi:MAG: NAD-dependent epimerase/dehydratase family protein [Flavobacteriales bacterium]|nr:NAD-dependent epimerase/dehydratase family protein [Flavobacteriales bacterium]